MAYANLRHRVLFEGGAQSLISIPRGKDGKPTRTTTAVYQIEDLRKDDDASDRVVVAEVAGSHNSVDTTITAIAGPTTANSRLLALTSATGVQVGHQFLLTDDATSRTHLCEVASLDGLNAYTRDPIPTVFASGSAFQGCEWTATFPSAEAADLERLKAGGGPYLLLWTWTGVDPAKQREIVEVTRTPTVPTIATLGDCMKVDPWCQRQLGTDPSAAEDCLVQAHLDLESELELIGLDPRKYYGSSVAREFVKLRFAYRVRMLLPGDEGEYNERIASEHLSRAMYLIGNLTGGKPPLGTVTVGANDDEVQPSRTNHPFRLT